MSASGLSILFIATIIGTEKKKIDVFQRSHLKHQHTREIIKNYVGKFQVVSLTDAQGRFTHIKVIK